MAGNDIVQNVQYQTNADDVIDSISSSVDNLSTEATKGFKTAGRQIEDFSGAVTSLSKGFKEIEANAIRASKAAAGDAASAKPFEEAIKITERLKGVLQDSSKIELVSNVPEAAKRLTKEFRTLEGVQKRLAEPNLGVEEVEKLKQTAFRATTAIANIEKAYEGVISPVAKLREEMKVLETAEVRLLPKETQKELSDTYQKMLLVSNSLVGLARDGKRGTQEFQNMSERAANLADESRALLGESEKAIEAFQSLNALTADTNALLEKQALLTQEETTNIRTSHEQAVALASVLKQQLQTNQLGTKEHRETLRTVGKLVKDSSKIVEEGKKTVSVEKSLEKLKKDNLKSTKEGIKIEKGRRKELEKRLKEEGVGGKGAFGFLRRRKMAAKEIGIPQTAALDKTKGAIKGITGSLGKLTNTVARAVPPITALLGAFAGFAAFAAAMIIADKRIKDARRQIIGMAGETGELNEILEKQGNHINVAASQIDIWRRKTEQFHNVFGLGMDESREAINELTKAGFKMTDAFDNFEGIYAQAVLTGKSFGEIASIAGQMREEFGDAIGSATDAMVEFREDAGQSGIATSRFFDKVMNAATGFGIYGTKIGEVSEGFSDLAKNMRLPEKAATEAAANMIGGFKDLSTEQQILTGQMSGYSKRVEKLLNKVQTAGTLAEKMEALTELKDLGIDEKEVKRLQKITDPLTKGMEVMRSLSPAEQLKARFDALTKAARIGIDINNSSIEEVRDALSKHGHRLETMSGQFGFRKEDIIALRSLSEGLAENKEAQNKMQSEWSKLSGVDIEKKLAEHFPELAKKFSESSEKDVKKFIAALDTDIDSLGKVQEDANAKAQKEEDIRAAKQLRMQTRSFSDAIEQTAMKVLNDIYTVLSTGFSVVENFLSGIFVGIQGGIGKILTAIGPTDAIKQKGLEMQLEALRAGNERRSKLAAKNAYNSEKRLVTLNSQISTLRSSATKGNSEAESTRKRITYLSNRLETASKEDKKLLEAQLSEARRQSREQQAEASTRHAELKKLESERAREQKKIEESKLTLARSEIAAETIEGTTMVSGEATEDSVKFNRGKISKLERALQNIDQQFTSQEKLAELQKKLAEASKKGDSAAASKLEGTISEEEKKLEKIRRRAEGRKIVVKRYGGKGFFEKFTKEMLGSYGLVQPVRTVETQAFGLDIDSDEIARSFQGAKAAAAKFDDTPATLERDTKFKPEESPSTLVGSSPVQEPGEIEEPKFKIPVEETPPLETETPVFPDPYTNVIKSLEGASPVETVAKLDESVVTPTMPTETDVSGETPTIVTPEPTVVEETGRPIHDNRQITINVNQRDRRQIEQIVQNALYTDKM